MAEESVEVYRDSLAEVARSGTVDGLLTVLNSGGVSLVDHLARAGSSGALWPTAADEVFYACEGNDRLEKMGALMEAGIAPKELRLLDVLLPFDPSLFGEGDCWNIDSASARRRLLNLIGRGARVVMEDAHPSDAVEVFRCFPDDLELYGTLEKAGFDFDFTALNHGDELADAFDPAELVDFLVLGAHSDTIRFVLGRGWDLSDAGCSYVTLRASWDESAVDTALAAGLKLGDFDARCPQGVVLHALEGGMMPRIEPDVLWRKVLDQDFTDVGSALMAAEEPFPPGELVVCPKNPKTLDWAHDAGFRLGYIEASAPKLVLMRAAQLGLLPCARFGGVRGVERGLESISRSLDFEVIGAFLDAGVEGLDPSFAIESGRDDIVGLFKQHGRSAIITYVTKPEPYIEGSVIRIPGGVTKIADETFRGDLEWRHFKGRKPWNISHIELPSTLKSIGKRAFAGAAGLNPDCIDEVVIPSSVTELGYGAFAGVRRIVAYDTINPDATYKLDDVETNGVTDATIAWAGIWPNTLEGHPDLEYSLCACEPNANTPNFEIEIRSAETGSVKYRVYMPLADLPRMPRSLWITSWGPHGEYHFEIADQLFNSIQSDQSKMHVALNRLLWPVNLSEKHAKLFRAFLPKCGENAAKSLIDDDNASGLKSLALLGLVTKNNVEDLIRYAKAGNRAPECTRLLEKIKEKLDFEKAQIGRRKPLVWDRKRTREFQELAEMGDVGGMREYAQRVGDGKLPGDGAEPATFFLLPKEQVDLWKSCCKQLNVDMLELLVNMGLDLSKAANMDNPSNPGHFFLTAELPEGRPEEACAFLRALMAHGLRFEDCQPTMEAQLWSLPWVLGNDLAVYDALAEHGLRFSCGHGSSDFMVFAAMVGENQMYRDVGVAIWFLGHGLSPEWEPRNEWSKPDVEELWNYWEENPSELAMLIPKIPVGSIAPAECLLPIVAKSGSLEALRALEDWEGAFAPEAVGAARNNADEGGLDEVVTYLDGWA